MKSIIPELLPYATVALAFQQRITSEDLCSSPLLQLSKCQKNLVEGCTCFGQGGFSPTNSSSPWTSQSTCHQNTETFCAFSSNDFAGGRGISILTTPSRVEKLQQLPAFVDADALSGVNGQPSPPFEEKELPGRGRGLIANKTLHRGDRIFAHTPIMIIDSESFGDLETEEWLDLEHAAVNNLPPKTQEMFLELYGRPVTDPVSDRIDTNAFVLDMEENTYYAVFPEIARLNHDCRPNAAYFFDKETLTHYVHAITDITPGTEITITYIDPHMPREKRLEKLSYLWGFDCSCSLCSLHPDLAHESDERLHQIATISERLQDWETAPPQMAQTLISLYEQERLYAPSSVAYWFAALTSCAEGLYWDTIRYARLAIELGVLDYGFRDEDFHLMRRLAREPESEGCWLARL
ncbi:SET domain-containing protein, partial [Trichoderma chlorosporum]